MSQLNSLFIEPTNANDVDYDVEESGKVIAANGANDSITTKMEKQIAQLWSEYPNFVGIEAENQSDTNEEDQEKKKLNDNDNDNEDAMDIDHDEEPSDSVMSGSNDQNEESDIPGTKGDQSDVADISWQEVKHHVHTKLWHAQSEISVALDVVQILLEGAKLRKEELERTNGISQNPSYLDIINKQLSGQNQKQSMQNSKNDGPSGAGINGGIKSQQQQSSQVGAQAKGVPSSNGQAPDGQNLGQQSDEIDSQYQTKEGHILPLPIDALVSNQISQPKLSNKDIIEKHEYGFMSKEYHIKEVCSILNEGTENLRRIKNVRSEKMWERLFEIRATGDFEKLRTEYFKSRSRRGDI
ncbi:hypothetical protein H4219_003815 [Mycoemilia scoparia]|uniref:Mediator of RNA polymerase II transcription subunit 17 n=1 Tax=Mycoemilia scoparia TaxID=417184 RepID=A0A9W8A060_9FUNG|nr:hypothetical protein H4219_003815 [Mycoemilia scoparia]